MRRVAELGSLAVMKPRLNLSTADWPEALVFIALLLLSLFVVPHSPLFVRFLFGALITGGAVWAGVTALRDRWQQSKTTGVFVGYYLRLAGIAFAIVLAWFLLMLVVARLVVR